MFAVPGWAVSPKSLVQQKTSSKDSNDSALASIKLASSKKRKRQKDGDLQRRKLSGTDLEKLWDQNFGEKEELLTKTNQGQGESVSESARAESNLKKPSTKIEEAKSVHTKKQRGEKPYGKRIDPVVDGSNEPIVSLTTTEPGRPRPTKKEKKERILHREERASNILPQTISSMPPPPPAPPATATLTPLQAKMRNKLTSARFRHLNQTLYTSSSSDALDLFKTSPDLFDEYHSGFSQQVKESWPQNPVNDYIREIKQRGQIHEKVGMGSKQVGPLPRRKTESCTIADLGCGDAPLARGCQSQIKALKLKFHNFDLHAPNSHVTVADVSNLPLRDGEADIAIFCLSLMGTNWVDFVEEAWRILRGDGKGEVWVAEVKSRFGRVTKGRVVENSVGKRKKLQKKRPVDGETDHRINGGEIFAEDEGVTDQAADETDISAFVKVFGRRGFQLQESSVNKSNKMFVSMTFVKSGIPTAGRHKGLRWNGKEYQKMHDGKMRFTSGDQDDQEVSPEEEARVLKPCVYKTR